MKRTTYQLLLFAILLLSLNCASGNRKKSTDMSSKIRGLSFVASPAPLDSSFDSGFVHLNGNALAIMPYAFMRDLNSTEIQYNINHQWWGEREEGCRETIRLAHARGYKVMLKPQIWIGRGGFTGHIEMKTEEDWEKWETNYKRFILLFAKVAEEEKVDLLCLGTEMGKPLKLRSDFWKSLVSSIKKEFSGKLTYAENWDCFDEVPFLDQLDFIGVNAYFPLSEKQNPSKKELVKAWRTPLEKMKVCSEKHAKPILLTEFGYRNMSYSAKEPWNSSKMFEKENEELQARLFEVCFEEVWSQSWVAGGYFWKWFPKGMNDGKDRSQFTPEDKLAEKTIQHYYSRKEK